MLKTNIYYELYSLRGLWLILLSGLLLNACSTAQDSPEEQIRKLIEIAEDSVEAKDHTGLSKLLANNFQSSRNLNKKSVEKMLQYYFLQNKTIYLFTRINQIDLLSPSHAKVKLAIAMTAQPISAESKLSEINADLYHFDLDVVNDNEWKILHAKWNRLQLIDF